MKRDIAIPYDPEFHIAGQRGSLGAEHPCEAFERFTERTETCWLWTGYISRSGYGVINIGGQPTPAHRFSYYLYKGSIPKKKVIHHRCGNRKCVRPAHLKCVSTSQHAAIHAGLNPHGNGSICRKGHPGRYRRPDGQMHCKECKSDYDKARYKRVKR